MSTFVIGDIHGAYRALKQLIHRLGPKTADTLIFLGDYVDGWSDVVAVVDYLKELRAVYNCVFIRGNHDEKCYQWLKNGVIVGDWLMHGGSLTQESYDGVEEQLIEKHLAFLEGLDNYYIDNQNRLFVHAGFTSLQGVEKEECVSNYYWDRTLWEMAFSLRLKNNNQTINLPKRLEVYNEIYIGHTATTKYNIDVPIQCFNLWNVDTGAAFTGKITALNIETKEFWQSDIVQTLYPDEKGRN